MSIIDTDEWTIQSLRCKKRTKEDLNKLLKYLGVTQDDYLNLSIDMNLERIAKGFKYDNDKDFPYLKNINRILLKRH